MLLGANRVTGHVRRPNNGTTNDRMLGKDRQLVSTCSIIDRMWKKGGLWSYVFYVRRNALQRKLRKTRWKHHQWKDQKSSYL